MESRSVLDDPSFQSAFLAVGHLLGAPKLPSSRTATPQALELAAALTASERPVRAAALARELERIARRLQERRVA